MTPVNQVLTPHGIQVELPGMRPQALALSPDGLLLAASGKTAQLVLVDPVTRTAKQRVATASRTRRNTRRDIVARIETRQRGSA